MPPNGIGKYIEPQLIGQGGFGCVYKAWDPDLARPVAIKVMHPHIAQDGEWVDRFQKEARFMAKIDQHPNIVRVIELHLSEQDVFMVMDYYANGNLEQMINSERPFSVERAKRSVLEIASGLSAAHASGIIHRDIKPENILISDQDTCKISDFGISASTDRSIYTRIGSPFYVAPEQALGRHTDARADIYALGVTLYKMITGGLPEELGRAELPPDPRVYKTDIPAQLVQILFKAIEFDPSNRYQSMGELIADIESSSSVPKSAPSTSYKPVAEPECPASNSNSVPNEGLSDPNFHFKLGVDAKRNQEFQKAIGHFTDTIQISPKYVNAYVNRGDSHLRLEQYQKAIADYDQAFLLDSAQPWSFWGRGRVYSMLSEHKKAIKEFDKAIKTFPCGNFFYNRGICYQMLGKNKQANKDFADAERLGIEEED